MGGNIWHIVKKEFDRFFRDKRMVFTAILMPALLIYSIYTIMGEGLESSFSVAENYVYRCSAQNVPDSFDIVMDQLNFAVTEVKEPEAEKEKIKNGECDLLVIFPENFAEKMMRLEQQPGGQVPNIKVYYHSTTTESTMAYQLFTTAVEQVEASVVNLVDVNKGVKDADLATENERSSAVVASMLPMLVVMLLFSGCMAVAPESIAGEKERGTIATLLVTPVSRTDIAVGKIISLSVFALLGGISSFIGVMLSLPKMMSVTGGNMDMNIYGIREYACILCVMISTVLLIVSLISVISAFAKTVKEATSMVAPLTLLSTLVGLLPMFQADMSGFGWRLVPILNSVLCLDEIFRFVYSPVQILVTCVSNLLYMLIFVVVLSKMFNSEKIMFKQ